MLLLHVHLVTQKLDPSINKASITPETQEKKNTSSKGGGGKAQLKRTAKKATASADDAMVVPLIRRLPRTVLEQLLIGVFNRVHALFSLPHFCLQTRDLCTI